MDFKGFLPPFFKNPNLFALLEKILRTPTISIYKTGVLVHIAKHLLNRALYLCPCQLIPKNWLSHEALLQREDAQMENWLMRKRPDSNSFEPVPQDSLPQKMAESLRIVQAGIIIQSIIERYFLSLKQIWL